jgi:hypothetical protein
MKPTVFLGPSHDGRLMDAFDLRPPATAGDLLALADEEPRTVALIDGAFDTAASVQHKEILELLSRGFRVLGAASMGAIRASELHVYGMVGVGQIFEAFARARLTADDEVAVLHAPREFNYQALTVALVDVRATLIAAVRARAIDVRAARAMRDDARACLWRDREWPILLKRWRGLVDPIALMEFERWLVPGSVSLKRRDAALCLDLAERPSNTAQLTPFPPRTVFFRRLAEQIGINLDALSGNAECTLPLQPISQR